MQTETLSQQVQLPQAMAARNPGMPLDLGWLRTVQANTSAI